MQTGRLLLFQVIFVLYLDQVPINILLNLAIMKVKGCRRADHSLILRSQRVTQLLQVKKCE